MRDRDLELLRSFRIEEAEPPPGLQSRVEERLWQAILAEEASRPPAQRRARWFHGLLRPAVAAAAAASIAAVVAVASDGGGTTVSGGSGGARQAGVLDSTATALFGDQVPGPAAPAPVVGVIDLSSADEQDATLARGPRLDDEGTLDADGVELVRSASRDPATLQARLRAIAADVSGRDPGDRVAFAISMQWVGSGAVPADLRAAMLRSLDGLQGVHGAVMGADLLGRDGVVLGHVDTTTGVRQQYLLDPDDGQLLERRTFTTAYVDPACPPGTFVDHGLYRSDGSPVTAADAPWLDWPLVVASCDPGVG